MNVLDLFSGIGGFSLGLERAGMKTVAFCEIEEFPRKVLQKHWPGVPIYEDIRGLIWELEQLAKEGLITPICKKPTRLNWPDVSPPNAQTAEQVSLFPQASAGEGAGSIAPGNVDPSSCAEKMGQTLVGEGGCGVSQTQTGEAVRDTKGSHEKIRKNQTSGEGGCSLEMDTSAKSAGFHQKKAASSTRTTSSLGPNTQNRDSTSQTGPRSASLATRKLIKGGIDVITAGVPCQPASIAGKRRGEKDDRWLWPETFEVIRLLHPTWCILENVGGFLTLDGGMAFEGACLALEAQGYEVQAFNIPACAVGAPHQRERIWIVANRNGERQSQSQGGQQKERGWFGDGGQVVPDPTSAGWDASGSAGETVSGPEAVERPPGRGGGEELLSDANQSGPQGHRGLRERAGEWPSRKVGEAIQGQRVIEPGLGGMANGTSPWLDEPDIPRVATGIKDRAARLKGLGNAVVPAIPEIIGRAIMKIEESYE